MLQIQTISFYLMQSGKIRQDGTNFAIKHKHLPEAEAFFINNCVHTWALHDPCTLTIFIAFLFSTLN